MTTFVRLSLADPVTDALRRQIITGEIVSGSPLAEDTLAEAFDVSRGPIRDALKVLRDEGLVEQQRGRWRSKPFSTAEVDELYGLRGALEGYALRRAMLGEPDWSELDAVVEKMAAAQERADQATMVAADFEFHNAIYQLSNSWRLTEAWQRYAPTFEVLLHLTNSPDPHSAVADHRRILALARGDEPEAAIAELLAHHERGAVIVRRYISEQSAPNEPPQTK